MTSPTNTAGLVAEIDAEMQGRRRGYADVRGELLFRCRDSLVTAASAEARIAELEARIEYLRGSRDGHAAQAHSEFEKRTMATDALIGARDALHHHYVECDRVLAALQQEPTT